MNILWQVEEAALTVLYEIKIIEDLNLTGELYHVTAQINYWLEILAVDDSDEHIRALQEVSRFLQKIARRKVKVCEQKYSRYS